MSLIKSVPVPLYHGTDKKIIDYSAEERTRIQELCIMISDYTFQLLSEDGLSVSSLFKYKAKRQLVFGDSWPQIMDAFQKYDSRKKGSNLYQYGSVYLTGDRRKAEIYARDAFIMGEQGKVAYWLYVAASKIWNLKECNPDMIDCCDSFESLMLKPHIPVLITFDSIPEEDLLNERGETIDWDLLGDAVTGLSYRLKPESKIKLYDGRIEFL